MSEIDIDINNLESFLQRLTGKKKSLKEVSLFCTLTNKVIRETVIFGRALGKVKNQPISVRKRVIRDELNSLIRRMGCDVPSDEDAIEWGVNTTQDTLDIMPSHLTYLSQTGFDIYLSKISTLFLDIINATKSSEITRLFRKYSTSKDTVTIAQFSSNEMVSYYRYLSKSKARITRQTIWKHLQIYQELCGIYEKDTILCYCLLQVKEGKRPNYAEVRKNTRNQTRVDFIKSQEKEGELAKPYDRIVRNAKAHTDVEIDVKNEVVRFYKSNSEQFKELSFKELISLTQEMSAVVSAFRLAVILLSNNYWKITKDILL
jgi:hypothetical protein